MTDPTDDKTLLEWIARFCGWHDLQTQPGVTLFGCLHPKHPFPSSVPDYLGSVDAWLRDVWPKIEHKANLKTEWDRLLGAIVLSEFVANRINADARSRCLALWRACEGKLP